MFPIRIKACSESDLRMLGNLARNIQRVLPVTQADIDAAAALGKGWVVWKVIEVNDPIDNLRGGTQLVIKQNSITPGQNVRRVLIVQGPGGETVVIGPGPSPLLLPDAIANSLRYVKAFGGTEQNGTPTPDTPVDIVSNNGVLKYSANMANVNTQTILLGYYISAQGVVTADANNWIYQDYIPVSPNTKYTLTMSSPVYYVSISEYSTASDSGFVIRKAGSTGTNTTLTITTSSTTNFIRFGTNIDRTEVTLEEVLAINWQLNKGNSMPYTPYSPTGFYTDGTVETIEDTIGNTATAEMLLKVDNYQDVQSIIDGVIIRNVGVKVLDSSLEWTYDSTYGRVNATIPNLWGSTVARTVPGLCTHFKWLSHQESISSITAGQCYSASANRIFLHISQTSAAAFAAWLDAQRDAGTPVIVVFPLENTTTESVAGQTLQVQAGNNTLEITQASLSGLELEAEYTKVA